MSAQPVVTMGMPPARTVPLPPAVAAAACGACVLAGFYGAWAATGLPFTVVGLLFVRTDATPPETVPPELFASPSV